MSTSVSRRDALLTGLFGVGWVGLRALATGLPISILANPRKALATNYPFACYDKTKAQYLILSTSGGGDPLNCNVPGTYDDPSIIHSPDPMMAATPITMNGQSYLGAKAWTALPQNVLDRTCFFHHATLTNSHANEPKVMKLMGATKRQEMFPSIFAKHLSSCLGTVQNEPAAIGGEQLSYEGRTLPVLSPTALKDILTATPGPLTQVQKIRDNDLNRINAVLKQDATMAQRAFIDSLTLSQSQARSIASNLLDMLAAVKDNGATGQITAAIALIMMNVSPVVSIHIPFGGDNHTDTLLAGETAQTVAGVGSIASLMAQLAANNIQDKVTFAAMNVFGRTLTNLQRTVDRRGNGRDHYASHHCTVMIGKAFKGGVIGAVGSRPMVGDLTAMPINSVSGKGELGGDIAFEDTLGAVGKTLGSAMGLDPFVLDDQILQGKVVPAALA